MHSPILIFYNLLSSAKYDTLYTYTLNFIGGFYEHKF